MDIIVGTRNTRSTTHVRNTRLKCRRRFRSSSRWWFLRWPWRRACSMWNNHRNRPPCISAKRKLRYCSCDRELARPPDRMSSNPDSSRTQSRIPYPPRTTRIQNTYTTRQGSAALTTPPTCLRLQRQQNVHEPQRWQNPADGCPQCGQPEALARSSGAAFRRKSNFVQRTSFDLAMEPSLWAKKWPQKNTISRRKCPEFHINQNGCPYDIRYFLYLYSSPPHSTNVKPSRSGVAISGALRSMGPESFCQSMKMRMLVSGLGFT